MVKVKNIRLAICGTVLSVLILACTDDTFPGADSGRTTGSAHIRLTVTIPDAEIVRSRAGEMNDASIQKLDVLLFDNTQGNGDETKVGLVARRAIDNIAANSVDLPLSGGQSRVVYVVANARKYLESVSVSDSQLRNADGSYKYSLAAIRNMLTTGLSASPDEDGFISGVDIPGIPVPMSGSVPFNSGLAENAEINVQLVRALSKISVSTPLSNSKFKIKGLTICNGAQTGKILSPVTLGDEGKRVARMAYTISGDSVLYTYPTAVGGIDRPVSVVVEAQYNGQEKSLFYRLLISNDLTDPDKGLSLGRNYHYLIKISKVETEGQLDLNTAISAPPANIDYTVEESNNYNNVTIIGGNMFSLDYDRLVIYADSLESTTLGTFRTDYPFGEGQYGNITVDEGLILIGNPYFTKKDTIKTIIVEVSPSYSYLAHSDTNPRGVHLSLGSYKKTIEVIRNTSLDLHSGVIELSGISNAKILSFSGDLSSDWATFSTSSIYSAYNQSSGLTNELLVQSGNKGYLHLDENLNNDYRELYMEAISTSGVGSKYILHQEGTKNYLLGFFGGILERTSNTAQYSKQLLIEAYEENEENLTMFTTSPSNAQKQELHALYENGKQSTIKLARDYHSPAALYCLNKNRDTNGNGRIDDDEVHWYLPGIRQGMGILFYQSVATNLQEKYWSSSCVYNNFGEGAYENPIDTHIEGIWALNTILSSNNGYIVFPQTYGTAVTQKRSIRCVRDL